MTWIALGPGPRLPPRNAEERWRRRGRLGAVLLAVLAAHGWLIGPVRTPLGRLPTPTPSATIQLVPPLPSNTPPAAEETTAATSEAEAPPRPPVPDEPPTPEAASPEPVPSPVPEPPVPPKPRDDRPVDWLAGPRPPESVTGTEPEPEEVPSGPGAPTPGPVGEAVDDSGARPPVYLTARPTQSFKLDYRLERGDESGVGQLSFELDANGRYVARFYGVTGNKALFDWVSRGGFDGAGLAPQRMAERSRGMDVRAANFQRDKAVISFSSSTRAFALFDGAQDRLSVLLQLMAIAEAQPGGLRPDQRIRLQVVSPRNQAVEWVFEVLGEERIEPDGTPIDTVHLKREPIQPYDQRVEVWLAKSAGHVPVGIRFTPVPGKASTAYWLRGRPAAPASAPSASAAAP